jgi:hypothetical protein
LALDFAQAIPLTNQSQYTSLLFHRQLIHTRYYYGCRTARPFMRVAAFERKTLARRHTAVLYGRYGALSTDSR